MHSNEEAEGFFEEFKTYPRSYGGCYYLRLSDNITKDHVIIDIVIFYVHDYKNAIEANSVSPYNVYYDTIFIISVLILIKLWKGQSSID